MLKRIVVALAGSIAMLGLVAAPTNADNAAAGSVELYELTDFNDVGGAVEIVPEVNIPTTCAPIPDNLPTVRSVRNLTSGSGTTIALFAEADSNCEGKPLARLEPSQQDPDIQDPSNPSVGAGNWMAVPS